MAGNRFVGGDEAARDVADAWELVSGEGRRGSLLEASIERIYCWRVSHGEDGVLLAIKSLVWAAAEALGFHPLVGMLDAGALPGVSRVEHSSLRGLLVVAFVACLRRLEGMVRRAQVLVARQGSLIATAHAAMVSGLLLHMLVRVLVRARWPRETYDWQLVLHRTDNVRGLLILNLLHVWRLAVVHLVPLVEVVDGRRMVAAVQDVVLQMLRLLRLLLEVPA